MTEKKPTVAQLLRKIERLEARLAASEAHRSTLTDVCHRTLYDGVDARMRITQAVAILSGEDE